MRGSRWIHIENYASVIEYGDKKVSVSGQGWTLRIQGLRLRIAYFTEDDMLVCGYDPKCGFSVGRWTRYVQTETKAAGLCPLPLFGGI